MSFSKFTPEQEEINRLGTEQSLFAAKKGNERFFQDFDKQTKDRQAQDEIDNLTKSLSQQKALDAAKKQKANYDAGIVDPDVAASEAIAKKSALDKAAESGMTDFQRYSQKNDYDLSNQEKAWESANKYRMREADQSNVAQKDRLVTQLDKTAEQENRLRRDDNQRAIDGFKLNF